MIALTLKSSNAKTGPIPVSTSSAATCPDACPLKKGGCYADGGPLAIHWRKVTSGDRGTDLGTFADQIRALPEGQVWRHNQAGDLPGTGNRIAPAMLRKIAEANRGRKGFTYTHKPLTSANLAAIREANQRGFTVNVSANNLAEVDAVPADIPAVTLLAADAPKVSHTPNGTRVVACPAESTDTTCATCGNGRPLCQRADRDFIVGFHVHGSASRKANLIAKG